MDLVSNPDNTKIVVLTDHVDKNGRPKIVQNCTLPLTGAQVVSTIITDMVRMAVQFHFTSADVCIVCFPSESRKGLPHPHRVGAECDC